MTTDTRTAVIEALKVATANGHYASAQTVTRQLRIRHRPLSEKTVAKHLRSLAQDNDQVRTARGLRNQVIYRWVNDVEYRRAQSGRRLARALSAALGDGAQATTLSNGIRIRLEMTHDQAAAIIAALGVEEN